MATRLGIELSPTACRLIEIETSSRGKDLRVRSFAIMPRSGMETDVVFASMKGRSAAVVVWSAAGDHRQAVVTESSYEAMRAEALDALRTAGVQTTGTLTDIAPVGGKAKRRSRRAVVVALADAPAIAEAIEPIVKAGIEVRSVVTPAVALGSIARIRRAFSLPGGIEIYAAVEESTTCVALMRDAVLTAARELPWGYLSNEATRETRTREDIADRLGLEIEQFCAAVGGSSSAATQVCVAGGVPELRTMTMTLMERLDVEVEPLDSMFGIDPVRLPAPDDQFRDRVAELRLAWAVAADWPPYLNLLRARHRERSRRTLAAAAVAAGVLVGAGGAAKIAQSINWAALMPKPAPRTAVAARRPVAPPQASAAPPRSTAPPARQASAPSQNASESRPPASAASQSSPASVSRASEGTPPRTVGAQSRGSTPPIQNVVPSTPQIRSLAPGTSPTSRQTTPTSPQTAPTPVQTAPMARRTPPSVRQTAPANVQVPPTRRESLPPPRETPPPERGSARTARPEPVLPFDAELATILYGPDRKLAMVDGRIVGVGDVVRGARVVEITPNAVMLRDAQGRLRRLVLPGGGN